MNMISTTQISTQDVIDKLQQLKGKTKLKFFKKRSNYYDNMKIIIDEDPLLKMLKFLLKSIMKCYS